MFKCILASAVMFLFAGAALAAYPDASNTGVPAGTVLTPSGSITVTVPGKVLDKLDIHGNVIIDANNVTLRRSKVTASANHLVKIRKGVTGFLIEDCELNGNGLNGRAGSEGITGRATVYRTNIHGVEKGFFMGNSSLIQDSYIHDLLAPGSNPDYIGIAQDGRYFMAVRHNTIIMNLDQTAAVYISAGHDFVADNNRLMGGNYTVICDGRDRANPITDVAFTNNRLRMGFLDYHLIVGCKATWSGNVDDVTGDPVPLN